jgi:peptidoglycan hydrolase CwlO-like protein
MTAEGLRAEIQRLHAKRDNLVRAQKRLVALHHLLATQADLPEEASRLEALVMSLKGNHKLLDSKIKPLIEFIDQDIGPD